MPIPTAPEAVPVPNPEEVATLLVSQTGSPAYNFQDWETVWVQIRWADAWPHFRFTCAERDPIPGLWQKLQFKPQDQCAIYLGGKLAIAGVIIQRQVSYDANQHAVMLYGKGVTWYAARGSILDKKSEYDNQTFEQIARKVVAPFGVGIKVVGTLDAIPYPKMQVQPGEKLFDFLERIARPKGIVVGSDEKGNFVSSANTPTCRTTSSSRASISFAVNASYRARISIPSTMFGPSMRRAMTITAQRQASSRPRSPDR